MMQLVDGRWQPRTSWERMQIQEAREAQSGQDDVLKGSELQTVAEDRNLVRTHKPSVQQNQQSNAQTEYDREVCLDFIVLVRLQDWY